MAISQKVKDDIEYNYQTHTIKQLSEKHGCSASSVSRIIAQCKKADADRSGAGAGTSTTANEGAPAPATATTSGNEGQDLDNYTYTPEDMNLREEIVLPSDADGGLQTLLGSYKQKDVDEESEAEDDAVAVAAAGQPSSNASQSEAIAQADTDPLTQAMDSLVNNNGGLPVQTLPSSEPSKDDMDSLLKGLLGDETEVASQPKRRGQAPAVTAAGPQQRANALVSTDKANGDSKGILPMSLLCVQARLYLQQFPQQLEIVTGSTQVEKDKFFKSIKPTMDRAELEGLIDGMKGILTVNNGVSMIRQTIGTTCAVGEAYGPYLGLQLQGLSAELMQQKEELDRISCMYVVSEYDWFAKQLSPKAMLAMLVSSTIMRVHNNNSILLAQQMNSTAVSPDVQEKYSGL